MPFRGHAFLTAAGVIVTSSHQDKTVAPVSVTVQIPYRYEKVTQAFSVHLPAWAVLTSIHFFLSFFFFVCFFFVVVFSSSYLGLSWKERLMRQAGEPMSGKAWPSNPLSRTATLCFHRDLIQIARHLSRNFALSGASSNIFLIYIYIFFFTGCTEIAPWIKGTL